MPHCYVGIDVSEQLGTTIEILESGLILEDERRCSTTIKLPHSCLLAGHVSPKVVSRDVDGTYTVRFKSPTKVPGATGARMKESGVSESDMREVREAKGGDTHAKALGLGAIRPNLT